MYKSGGNDEVKEIKTHKTLKEQTVNKEEKWRGKKKKKEKERGERNTQRIELEGWERKKERERYGCEWKDGKGEKTKLKANKCVFVMLWFLTTGFYQGW